MIDISKAAIEYLKQKRSEDGPPVSHAVRVYPQAPGGEGPEVQLAMTFAADPEEEGDRRVEVNGICFYIAPEVTEALEGVVIDITTQPGRLGLRTRKPTG